MSGTVYSITPNLGVAFNQTYGPGSGGPSPPATGPQYPPDILQMGMAPGKVMQGSDATRYILAQNQATAQAANATVNVSSTNFTIGGTGGIAAQTVVAVPANNLCWCRLTAPIP